MKTVMTSFMTFFVTIGTQTGSLNVTKKLYVVKLPTTGGLDEGPPTLP